MTRDLSVYAEAETMARDLAVSCERSAVEQPKYRDYWLSEAKRHEQRADDYRKWGAWKAKIKESADVH